MGARYITMRRLFGNLLQRANFTNRQYGNIRRVTMARATAIYGITTTNSIRTRRSLIFVAFATRLTRPRYAKSVQLVVTLASNVGNSIRSLVRRALRMVRVN